MELNKPLLSRADLISNLLETKQKESDLSAVVYGDTAKLYANRILANGKTPVHFNDMTIIK